MKADMHTPGMRETQIDSEDTASNHDWQKTTVLYERMGAKTSISL